MLVMFGDATKGARCEVAAINGRERRLTDDAAAIGSITDRRGSLCFL
jgi:hypothetical protein